MSTEREAKPLQDMRFAADLRRQFEDLARRTQQPHLSPAARSRALLARHRWVAAGAIVTAVVLGFVLIGAPSVSRYSGPEPVSAAQLIEKALKALSSAETLQADSVEKYAVGRTSSGDVKYGFTHRRVYLRSDGSYRFVLTDKPQSRRPPLLRTRFDAEDEGYDAARGVWWSYVRGWDGGYLNRVEVTEGAGLGPPDAWPPLRGFDFAAMALALLDAGDATVETTTYRGRQVWVVAVSTAQVLEGSQVHDLALTTIDQDLGLPMRFQLFVDGILSFEYRWSDVRIDEPLPEDAFAFTPPKGAEVLRSEDGFRRVPPSMLGSERADLTLLPKWLPDGYELRWAAVAPHWTTANGFVEARDVVDLQYTRGFESLTVTTRTVLDPDVAASCDPFEEDPAWADVLSRKVLLESGFFAGVTARVVIGPRISTPHLWAVKDGILLTVAGRATVKELIEVAQSVEEQ